jgi:hypothetical protein
MPLLAQESKEFLVGWGALQILWGNQEYRHLLSPELFPPPRPSSLF